MITNQYEVGIIIIPVLQMRSWGTEKLSDFPKVTQSVSVWARICTRLRISSSRNTLLLSRSLQQLEHMEERLVTHERSKVIFKCFYSNICYNMDIVFSYQFLTELYPAAGGLDTSIPEIIRAVSTTDAYWPVAGVLTFIAIMFMIFTVIVIIIIITIIHWGLTRFQEPCLGHYLNDFIYSQSNVMACV